MEIPTVLKRLLSFGYWRLVFDRVLFHLSSDPWSMLSDFRWWFKESGWGWRLYLVGLTGIVVCGFFGGWLQHTANPTTSNIPAYVTVGFFVAAVLLDLRLVGPVGVLLCLSTAIWLRSAETPPSPSYFLHATFVFGAVCVVSMWLGRWNFVRSQKRNLRAWRDPDTFD